MTYRAPWKLALSLALYLGYAACLGCARPSSPTLTPKVARVAGVSAQGLDLDIELQVDNPNTFALHANEVTGTVYVGDGKRLARGSSRPGQSIPARGTAIVPSRVHVEWEDATAIAPLLLHERVPYQLRGDVALGSDNFNITLPFNLSGELSRAQLLEAGLRGL